MCCHLVAEQKNVTKLPHVMSTFMQLLVVLVDQMWLSGEKKHALSDSGDEIPFS